MRSPHLHKAHTLWKELVHPSDIVIDATAGNGHDTVFLSHLVKSGKIYAIDIQPQALLNTQNKIGPNPCIEYICASHVSFPPSIEKGSVQLIVYNLGYLPGGDKSLTTLTSTTITSLQNALPLLKPGGAISIMLYPGHEEGAKEEQALLAYVKTLDLEVHHYKWGDNPKHPSLLWLVKK